MIMFIQRKKSFFIMLVTCLVLVFGVGKAVSAQEGGGKDPDAERQAYFDRVEADILAGMENPESPDMAFTPCAAGFAGPYPCDHVDLLAFMSLGSIGGGSGNDIWGWTDPEDGSEYAIMGRSSGTSFVDISDPENPIYLGNLPTHTTNTSWRDIKVYNNYAFVVSEAGGHGMQVFDLTRLRNVVSPPVTFTEDAHFAGFGSAHNIVINEDTGFAYKVGGSTCSGGLHFVNISNPLVPTDAGCYSGDGYTHDAQCVVYTGPDTDYQGDEICFAFNEDTLTIVNVTIKNAPTLIARQGYAGDGYTHQGWVTEDQVHLLLDDELDELDFGHNTRTRVWDISNLDNPVLTGFFDGPNGSIDHNLYIKSGYAYESNYTSGLHILDITDIGSATLDLVAYFDTYTANNSTSFNGTWSNYPYFDSGVVIVSGIGEGLFILKPNLDSDYSISADPNTLNVCVAGSLTAEVDVDPSSGYSGTVDLSTVGLPAGSSSVFVPTSVVVPGSAVMTVTVSTTSPGIYPFDIHGTDGSIQHDEAMTLNILSGTPAAPSLVFPANGALDVVTDPVFTWNASAETASYAFELATDPGFSNIIDSSVQSGTSHPVGVGLNPLTTYYWRVRGDNLCGSGSNSVTSSFTTRDTPPILLVDDDDNAPDVRSDYTDTLDALGLTYDIFNTNNSDIEPSGVVLSAYQAVIWFSGDEFGGSAGPGSAGEVALESWLDAGGCLFVSSQDYFYDRGLTPFMSFYLGVSGVINDSGNYSSVTGQNLFSGLGPYTLSYPPLSDFSDKVTPGNGGLAAFEGNNGNVAAVYKSTSDYKTSFWAFPWETFSVSGREASLDAFMDWCGLDAPPVLDQVIFLPVVVKDP